MKSNEIKPDMKFNNWTVIKFDHKDNSGKNYFLCRCICGKEKPVRGSDLINEVSKSCGCTKKKLRNKILPGNVYGRWTVIEFIGVKNWRSFFLCKCECGEEREIDGANLVNGASYSCGCYQKEVIRLEKGRSVINRLYRRYKREALEKGREFILTMEEFEKLIFDYCFYCGSEPSNQTNDPNSYGNIAYNGIDRIDNSKGYTIDNVVTCCIDCNRAKLEMTQNDFFEMIERIYNH